MTRIFSGREMTSLSTRLREVAEEYAEELSGVFKERLVSVVLFGSVARGEGGGSVHRFRSVR